MTPAEALQAALDVIERDELAAYSRLIDALDGLTIGCDVDGERFTVRTADRPIVVRGDDPRTDAHVSARRSAILALIDGDIQLLDAVRSRRLEIVADISLMVRLSSAQRAFAEGAARTRRVRPILEAFRRGA